MEPDVERGPAIWPGAPLAVQPGDLTQFATHGYGFGAPLVMMPWDDLGTMVARGNVYGVAPPRTGNPFADAPRTKPSGGTLYFDEYLARTDLEAALNVMHVSLHDRNFAVFEAEASDPVASRFLVQRRIVPAGALRTLFGISNADLANGPSTQPMAAREAIFTFLDAQRARWCGASRSALAGTLGGDGDWASESLAFGLTVENAEHDIVRVWSRPWLVTK